MIDYVFLLNAQEFKEAMSQREIFCTILAGTDPKELVHIIHDLTFIVWGGYELVCKFLSVHYSDHNTAQAIKESLRTSQLLQVHYYARKYYTAERKKDCFRKKKI